MAMHVVRVVGRLGMLLAVAAGPSACMEAPGASGLPGSSYAASPGPVSAAEVGQTTYRAVDRLVDGGAGRLNPNGVIVVGTIADIKDLGTSGPFGNLVADLVRTRLVQRGLPVVELRLRTAIHLDRSEGEMTLARDRRQVLAPPDASEILTGTYTEGPGLTYVSLKVVSMANARILAAVDFAVPRGQ